MHYKTPDVDGIGNKRLNLIALLTVFALAVMEYAVGVSRFGKNPMTLLVHQY